MPAVTPLRHCRWCYLAGDQTFGSSRALAKDGQSVPGDDGLRLGAEKASAAQASEAEDAAFVVLGDPPGHQDDGESGRLGGSKGLTLVPRKHVRTLAELPQPEVAEVLAGLFRATVAVRELSGAEQVEIRADMDGLAVRHGHVHFRVEPVAVLGREAGDGCDAGEDGRGRRSRSGGGAGMRRLERVPSHDGH